MTCVLLQPHLRQRAPTAGSRVKTRSVSQNSGDVTATRTVTRTRRGVRTNVSTRSSVVMTTRRVCRNTGSVMDMATVQTGPTNWHVVVRSNVSLTQLYTFVGLMVSFSFVNVDLILVLRPEEGRVKEGWWEGGTVKEGWWEGGQ